MLESISEMTNKSNTKGVIIFGSTRLSIGLSRAIESIGIRVLLCDINSDRLKYAQSCGLTTYQINSNPNDIFGQIELANYNTYLGLSDNNQTNLILANQFKERFGAGQTYVISNICKTDDKNGLIKDLSSQTLFGESINSASLKSQYATFKTTVKTMKLRENFDRKRWQSRAPKPVTLCVLSKTGELRFITSQDDFEVKKDDQLVYISSAF